MRKYFIGRLALLLAICFIGVGVNAQTITIDNANFSTASYGVGGNITVPISVSSGCFDQNNSFLLYLSDAAGNFAPGTLIGAYNSFFTPYINGIIPNGTAPGAGYKVRVVSTSPAGITATSNAFTIVATASNTIANPTTTAGNTINDTTFGKCTFTSNGNLNLTVTVPGGTTMSAKVLDKNFGNVAATVGATTISFLMQTGNYYTVQITIKNNSDNSVSIKSYLVLASNNNLNFQTSGSNEICLPDTARYIINPAGIANNYPGNIYSVDWGDGVTTTFTHCQLLAAGGNVMHLYTTTSCGRPPITDITPNQYNAYKVNLTANNRFCASSSFTPITSYAKVWARPQAEFVNPQYGCVNTPITFQNTSQAGLSGYNNAQNCTNASQYEWYVDGIFVASTTNLTHTFVTTGNHTIQLVAVNDPCSDDTTMTICIEPRPNPDFKLNGQDVLSGCTGLVANVTHNIVNTNPCRANTWQWSVVKVPGPAVQGTDYTVSPSLADSTPQFTFLTPGTYYIRLTLTNSCGSFFDEDTVIIRLNAVVTLPANRRYCGLQTIDFGTNLNHQPTYNTNAGNETYLWSVTGGTANINNTGIRYPTIQFTQYATYTVQVIFTNDCGADTATQQIIFDEPVNVNAGPNDTVCYSALTYQVNGSTSGPAGYTTSWQVLAPATGTLNNNSPTPIYTFTANDKIIGQVKLLYTATPPAGSVCTVMRDTITINIRPDNVVTNATKEICSGQSVNHTITSSQAGSTYAWTSSGTATGNTPAGNTTLINDILTNPSNSTDATMTYTITATKNGCTGPQGTLVVTVKPIPVLTATPSATTICSGATVTINLSSTVTGSTFTWTSVKSSPNIAGNSSSSTTGAGFSDLLTNSGSTDETVTYTINVAGPSPSSCAGTPQTVVITVKPGVSVANAGPDQKLCNLTTATLAGNTPTVGTGTWAQVSGPNTATIANANAANSGLSGLIPGTYQFSWTITGSLGTCPPTSDNVNIIVRPAVTTSNAGPNQVLCDFVAGTNNTVTLAANAPANPGFETGVWTFVGAPNGATINTPSSPTSTVTFTNPGTYQLQWSISNDATSCAASTSTVTIKVYALPVGGTLASSANVCSGSNNGTLTLSGFTGVIVKWQFSTNGGGTWSDIANTTTTQTYTNLTTTTMYRVVLTSSGTADGCNTTVNSNAVTITVSPLPTVSPETATACSGTAFNVTPSTAPGGTTYTWTAPTGTGFTGGSAQPVPQTSIGQTLTNTTTAPVTATYTVTPTLGSCAGAPFTVTITINPRATITNTPLNQTICSNTASAAVIFTASTAGANTTYAWTGSTANGITGFTASGNGDLSAMTLVNPNNTQGSVVYVVTPTYTNNSLACAGTPVNYTIFVNPTPNVVATPAVQSICSGATTSIALSSNVTGTTYAWTVSANANITGAAAGAGNSIAQTLSNTSTSDQTITYTITPTYTNNSVSCPGAPITVDITVKATPDVIINPGPQTICSGTSSVLVTLSSVVPGATFDWTASATAGITGVAANQTNTTTIPAMTLLNANTTPGTVTFTITPKTSGGGACSGSNVTYTITVNPAPNVSFTPTGETICSGATTTAVTLSSTTPGATFTWTSAANGAGGVTASGNGNIPAQILTNGTNAPISVVYTATASTSGGTACPGTPNNYTVVVNPIPNAIATPSSQTICSATATSIAVSSVVSGTVFSWTASVNANVTGAAAGNGSSIAQTLINTSTTPQNITYTITPAYTNAGRTCTGTPITVTITVNPTTTVTNTPLNQTICSNTASTQVILTSSTAGANTTFSWTGSTANGITGFTASGTGDIPAMTLVNPNNTQGSVVYVVTPTYTNNSVACTGTPVNYTIFVNPTPNVVATPALQTICSSTATSIALTSNVSGTTFAWTVSANPNITGAAAGNGASIAQTLSNSSTTDQVVTYTITPTYTNNAVGCAGTPITVNITVKPTPDVTINPGPQTICSGTSSVLVTLSSAVSGATFDWTATATAGVTGFTASGSNTTTIPAMTLVNATTNPGTVTFTITPKTTGGGACAGSSVTYTITVNPAPNVIFNPAGETICSGATTTAVTLSSTTPGATFTWTSAANGAGGVTASGNGNIPAQTLTNGTNAPISVVYTATAATSGSASCPGTPNNYTVVVNPIPNAVATPSSQTICSATATSIALTSAVSGTAFSWTVSANANITGAAAGNGTTIAQTLTNTSATPQNITYTITPAYTNAGRTCNGTPITVVITVNPNATVTNSPLNQTICSNTSTTAVTFTSSTATLSTTFAWTGSTANGITGFTANGSGGLPVMTLINPNNTQGSVVFVVTPTYSNNAVSCAGTPSNYTIFVNPTPNVILPAAQTICSGSTTANVPLNSNVVGTIFNYTAVPSSSGVTGFTASANGVTSIAPQAITNASNTVQTVTYTITPFASGCPGSSQTYTITINPTPGVTLPPNQTICSGATSALVTLTSDVAGATFNWTATPSSGGISGYTPAANNVTTIPPQTIFNNNTTPGTVIYNVTPITSGSTSCPGTAVPYTITINPSPIINFSGPDQTICSGSTSAAINITSTTPGAVIAWTSNANGAGGVTATGSNTIPVQTITNTTNAPITVTYTANGTTNDAAACPGPFKTYSITVNPVPNVVATPSSASICTNTSTNISLSSFLPSTIFNWTVVVTGGITGASNGTGNSIVQTLVNNGVNPETATYTITPSFTNNGKTCSGTPINVVVTVNPIATITNSPLSQTICTNTATTPVVWTSFTAGTTFAWTASSPNGVTGFPASGNGNLPAMTLVNPNGTQGTVTVMVTSTANFCSGPPTPYTITVNPDARAQMNVIADSGCAPFLIDNTNGVRPVLYPSQNNGYNWYANNIFYGTSANQNPGYTLVNPGDSVTIKMVAISLYGCKNDSVEHKFYTVPKPVTSFTASDTVGCGPLSVTFLNTTPNINWFTYFWDFGNGQTFTGAQPGIRVFQPNPTYNDTTYTVSLTAFTRCDTVAFTRTIRVKSKPKALFTPSTTYGCSPLTVSFLNTTLGLNVTYKWDFGDGSPTFSTNTQQSVSHTFHTGQQDTFHVKLIATNECGSDTATYAVVVAARTINLNFAVNGNQITGCSPHTVQFINNSNGATNFIWTFGDGNGTTSLKNVDTITHTYTAIGSFVVLVKASNGCTDTTGTITINVYRKPIPDFSAFPLPACIGDTINFINQTDTSNSLLWQFGNGATSQLTNPQYAYTTAGTYPVKLIAVRQYGPGNFCTDSITKPITVVASLPGSFSVSDSVSTCVPFSVIFTNNTHPSVLTTWNYGDGNVDTGDIVSHTYTQVGTYTVTMTANDLGGCKYIATKQIIVNGPAGAFIYDHGFICGNTPVRFEANVTGTDSLRWNFGDGITLTSTSNVVYHTYAQSGSYVPTVRLLAGVGGNCTRLLQGVDTIKVDYVDAGFKSAATKICGATSVAFTDTSRAHFGIQSWQWNFGDGNTSGVQHPVHVYNASNTWPVRLIVTGVSGCSDTMSMPLFVKVDSKPVAAIIHPPTGCVNQPVLYNSSVISPDPVTYYSWTFSNLATGNTPSVQNNYAAPGNYNAQLIVGTSFGCYDTVNSPITINPSPFVNTNPDMQICRGQSAQLNATGGLTYTWAPFTGLSCTTCPNPIASPLTTTQYVVTGYNSFGCAGRDTILITVPQPIDVIATPPVTLCIGQSVQLNATGAASYVWSPATALSATNIPNPIASPVITTIYRVIGFDAHNCFQDTAYVPVAVGNYPVVNVGKDTVLATGSTITLTPTATNGPIGLWSWTPSTDLSCANCPNPIATAKKDICYTVTATNLFGCSGKDTMCIRVFCEGSQVFIPNAFTPDADGINDVLTVKGKGIKTVKIFRIFNRWGQVVFEKSNFQPNIDSYGWNGTINGVPAPPDVYVYTCEVVCEDGTPYTYKGNVAILK